MGGDDGGCGERWLDGDAGTSVAADDAQTGALNRGKVRAGNGGLETGRWGGGEGACRAAARSAASVKAAGLSTRPGSLLFGNKKDDNEAHELDGSCGDGDTEAGGRTPYFTDNSGRLRPAAARCAAARPRPRRSMTRAWRIGWMLASSDYDGWRKPLQAGHFVLPLRCRGSLLCETERRA